MPRGAGDSAPNPGFNDPQDADRAMRAEFLRVRAEELASIAARLLLDRHPDLHTRYRPMPALKWSPHLAARVLDLSGAVLAGRPEVFAAQLAWTRVAFGARGVPLDDLRRSLETLHEVLEHESPPDDRPELATYFRAALSALAGGMHEPLPLLPTGTPEGALAARYLASVLEGDRLAACEHLVRAVHGGLTVKSAYLDVLAPVQEELGRLWHLNEISVAEEHFGTATTIMALAQLRGLTPRAPRDGRVVLATCVQGNDHDVGVRMVADFLEMNGWRAIHLGADVPVEDLAHAARSFGVHLAALSVSLPTQYREAQETIRALRADGPAGLRIMVGGGGVSGAPGVWAGWGADGWAESAAGAVAEAERLVPAR